MNIEKPSELLNPVEINNAIGYVREHLARVASMGGNDDEFPIAQQFLNKLESGQPVAKSELERMMKRLGNPVDDKSSNYH